MATVVAPLRPSSRAALGPPRRSTARLTPMGSSGSFIGLDLKRTSTCTRRCMPQTTSKTLGVPVLAPIFAGTFVALLDLSIVIVALPTIQVELNTDVTGVQWVVDAFVLPLGALLLSGGALGDRYGRKRIFLGGRTLFLNRSVI